MRSNMRCGLAHAVLSWDDVGEPTCARGAALVVKVAVGVYEVFDVDLTGGRAVVRLVGGRLRGNRDACCYVRRAEEMAAWRRSIVARLKARQFRPRVWCEGNQTDKYGAPVACPR